MAVGRRSRRRTRYFVQRVDGDDTRIARITAQGSPSFFDDASGTWVHDPLLGAEIRLSDDWVRVDEADLPVADDARPPTSPTSPTSPTDETRRGRTPKGRHAQAGPG
jgi:hypothetical protein